MAPCVMERFVLSPLRPPRISAKERRSVLNRPTVMIFEENQEMREHYQQFLKSDYNLLMVETARYGVKMLQSLPVDVILLNVEVKKEMQAVGMLKIFRRMAAGAAIPVIAMTGYSGTEERALLHSADFDAYLSRPFTLRQLRDVISRCMARRTVSILNEVDLSAFATV